MAALERVYRGEGPAKGGGPAAAVLGSPGQWLPGRPLAVFDFDSTLIPWKRGGGIPLDERMESYRTQVSLSLLAALMTQRRFNVAIITNTKDVEALKAYVQRLDDMVGSLGAWVMAANDSASTWRKPHLGSLLWMADAVGLLADKPRLTAPGSFYCGDAGGRAGDFAASDYLFAHNAQIAGFGLKFIHADDLFLSPRGAPLRPSAKAETIDRLLQWPPAPGAPAYPTEDLAAAWVGRPVLVLMIGAPGSGKSRLAEQITRWCNGTRVSHDMYPLHHAFEVQLALAMKTRRPVIVDDQNRTVRVRGNLYRAAREMGYQCAAVEVATPVEMCLHLNAARRELGGASVPDIAIYAFFKQLEPFALLPEEGRSIPYVRVEFALDGEPPLEILKYRWVR